MQLLLLTPLPPPQLQSPPGRVAAAAGESFLGTDGFLPLRLLLHPIRQLCSSPRGSCHSISERKQWGCTTQTEVRPWPFPQAGDLNSFGGNSGDDDERAPRIGAAVKDFVWMQLPFPRRPPPVSFPPLEPLIACDPHQAAEEATNPILA